MMIGAFVHIVLSTSFGAGSYIDPLEGRGSIYEPAVAVSADIEIEPCTGQRLFHVHFISQSGNHLSYYTRQSFNVGGRYFLLGDAEGSIVQNADISFFSSNTELVAQEVLDAAQISDCSVVNHSANAYLIVTVPTTPRDEMVLLPPDDAESLHLSGAAEILVMKITNEESDAWTSEVNMQFFAVPIATMMSNMPPPE